ncbi:hypothetical protein [Halomonas aquatica]|uniref:Transposase n=1 Tax=Halomonas aquatica TaxID=3151123 RepID=A0ABV1NF82_9GAMM
MDARDKKSLSERDICTKFITPKWSHTVSRLKQAWQIGDGEAP